MPTLKEQDVRNLLNDEDTYGTTLLIWALDTFGPEVVEWHPAVIRRETGEFLHRKLRPASFDRLMAAIAVVTTDLFFTNVSMFSSLANALCGDGFRPAEFDPPEAVECAWATTEALLLWPPDDDSEEIFSPDIRKFIGEILKEEGFTQAPDILGIATGLDGMSRIRQYHGHDPALLARIHARQAQLNAEIRDAVQDGLRDLIDQLERLPLAHGSTKDIAQKFRLKAQQAT